MVKKTFLHHKNSLRMKRRLYERKTKLTLAELRCATCGLEAVLHLFAGADLLDIPGFSAPSLMS